jgi:hypothetical protein
MRFPLRTLLAAPWLRFRLSLLSFLLGSTLVAVIVAHWFAAREVDRLRLQVAALQAENKDHRDRLGILTVSDAALAHAIYSPEYRSMPLNSWQWKFYTPKGRQFRLCLACDGIARDGALPASDTRTVVLADNLPVEGSVTCSIFKGGANDPQSGHIIVHLDRITKKFELPQDSSAWVRPTIQYEKQIGGQMATLNAAAGQPLVLLRLRGYRVTEVEQNGAKAHPRLPPDDSPGPGVLLWIEEQPSTLTAAS